MVTPMSPISFLDWPVLRQLRSHDRTGRGAAVESRETREASARVTHADTVARSVCPYCAVGCGQLVFGKDGKVLHVEGDPDSPVSRGRLCPKGSASEQLANSALRETKLLYRAPYATEWTELDHDTAMDMIADRFLEARRNHWEDFDDQGRPLRRTMGIASLGGATIDNEENYLAKKLFTAAGAIQMENQARI